VEPGTTAGQPTGQAGVPSTRDHGVSIKPRLRSQQAAINKILGLSEQRGGSVSILRGTAKLSIRKLS
jgi:hypothetical protein